MAKRVKLEFVDPPWSFVLNKLPGLIAYGMGEGLSNDDAMEKYWPQVEKDAKSGKLLLRNDATRGPINPRSFFLHGMVLKTGCCVCYDVLKRYMWHRHRIKVATTGDNAIPSTPERTDR